MRMGPSKPITDVRTAAGFLKQLAKASNRHFPTTAERLRDIVQVLRRVQARDRGSSPDRAETGTGSGSEASRAPVPKAIAP
jgi:hypothetical protein